MVTGGKKRKTSSQGETVQRKKAKATTAGAGRKKERAGVQERAPETDHRQKTKQTRGAACEGYRTLTVPARQKTKWKQVSELSSKFLSNLMEANANAIVETSSGTTAADIQNHLNALSSKLKQSMRHLKVPMDKQGVNYDTMRKTKAVCSETLDKNNARIQDLNEHIFKYEQLVKKSSAELNRLQNVSQVGEELQLSEDLGVEPLVSTAPKIPPLPVECFNLPQTTVMYCITSGE